MFSRKIVEKISTLKETKSVLASLVPETGQSYEKKSKTRIHAVGSSLVFDISYSTKSSFESSKKNYLGMTHYLLSLTSNRS